MDHTHSASALGKRRLTLVFVITAVYLVAEVVGGILTHSWVSSRGRHIFKN